LGESRNAESFDNKLQNQNSLHSCHRSRAFSSAIWISLLITLSRNDPKAGKRRPTGNQQEVLEQRKIYSQSNHKSCGTTDLRQWKSLWRTLLSPFEILPLATIVLMDRDWPSLEWPDGDIEDATPVKATWNSFQSIVKTSGTSLPQVCRSARFRSF
jgi:hypothetical protein